MKNIKLTYTIIISVLVIFLRVSLTFADGLPKCLYVSSYHKGFDWSDRVELALRKVLTGKCEIKQFDMDTKRNKDLVYKQETGMKVKQLIESWQPDVVITSDDNAAKFVIQPYFKDHTMPFVFLGVNWTVKEYGFPYKNVTGMIEVAPIEPMLKKAAEFSLPGRKAIYIGADTFTEWKNLERVKGAATKLGIELDHALVPTTSGWIKAYKQGQKYDFLIIGTSIGIDDWNPDAVKKIILADSKRLSVTSRGWMMPFTMLGFTKIPEEHGEWAAQTALAILDGISPDQIPIVSNRKWDLWINPSILKITNIRLPDRILKKAKKKE